MKYYCTQRPAGPGCQPKDGLVAILPPEQPEWLPKHVYSVLEYSRDLTRREVMEYELTPDYPPVDYKGYPIRFLPYTWEWVILDPEEREPMPLAYCDTLESAKAMIDEIPQSAPSEPVTAKTKKNPPKRRKALRKPF